MTFFLPLSKHAIVFFNRTTPGAGARNCNHQKWEEPRWKPVQDPPAEKWNHGRNVSAEGKRLAAVSEAARVSGHIFISCCYTLKNFCHYFTVMNMNKICCLSIIQSNTSGINAYLWNGKDVSEPLCYCHAIKGVSVASQEINQGRVGATQQREYAVWGGRKSSWGRGAG